MIDFIHKMKWQVLLIEMAEKEIEIEEGNVMIERAARTGKGMIGIGVGVEAEKGIGGEIDLEIMIGRKNMGGRGTGIGIGTGTVIELYQTVPKFWFHLSFETLAVNVSSFGGGHLL